MQPGEFWDVVVVTAVDESQKDAYELQISEKVVRKELPLGIQYKVFSDPPGPKIGGWVRRTISSFILQYCLLLRDTNKALHCYYFTDMTLCFQGNGGSTLYALQQLNDIFGKTLGELRVILIHAGLTFQNCLLPKVQYIVHIFLFFHCFFLNSCLYEYYYFWLVYWLKNKVIPKLKG